MAVPIYQVDAFTSEPFAGNPAAVCILGETRPEAWMQSVALEMNLSETAFLCRRGDDFDLRWFTPAKEVDLCGHATLASAHTLWETGLLARDRDARFHTRSGVLTASWQDGRIAMDFPALPTESIEMTPALRSFLGLDPVFAGRSRFDYLVELASERSVRDFVPNLAAIAADEARGVIVTAQGDDFDFVSRYFAPSFGIDEDPVTGSAHSCLGPYWEDKLGRREFRAYQASARGGVVHVEVRGDRVTLGGTAVTTLRGELTC